jgi:hypothetical protein
MQAFAQHLLVVRFAAEEPDFVQLFGFRVSINSIAKQHVVSHPEHLAKTLQVSKTGLHQALALAQISWRFYK